MAKDSSFDVVSEVDRQEVDNAVNQARKEIITRFDFKGTDADVSWSGDLEIEVKANAEERCKAALEVLKEKAVRREVSLKALHASEPKPTGGKAFKIEVKISQGIDTEKAKAIVKTLKDAKIKVQASIQGEQVRVSGKKRDDLQEAIALLKDSDFGIPLQFTNYR